MSEIKTVPLRTQQLLKSINFGLEIKTVPLQTQKLLKSINFG